MVASIPQNADRDLLIRRLNDVRDTYETARQSRIDLILQARECGISFHHIAMAVGLTEGGVRKLAERATTAA